MPALFESSALQAKAPLTLKEIWAIRGRLQLAGDIPQLALFDNGIDNELGAFDHSHAG